MSNHRWNIEAIFYEYENKKKHIIQIKKFDYAKSKKEALNKLKEIDNRRIKTLNWQHWIYKVY